MGSSFAVNEAKEHLDFSVPVELNGQLRKDAFESFVWWLLPYFPTYRRMKSKMDETVAAELPSCYNFFFPNKKPLLFLVQFIHDVS